MNIRLRCDKALAASLPRPTPARQALPDWLRAMQMREPSDMHAGAIRTVKQCPPFVDAMRSGFMMPLACDVIYEDGRFSWDWDLPEPSLPDHPHAPINFHASAQLRGAPFGDDNLLKFIGFWTIELPPGWSLLATHPFNRDDLPFRTLTGLVDSDRFHDIGLLFPARWLDPSRAACIKRGTPIAQCLPIQRGEPSLEFGVIEDAERFASVGRNILSEPGVYRRRYRDRAR